MQVESFVPAGSVDPVYFSGSNYYLGPDGLPAQKPYALLCRVMEEQGLQAFATAYVRGRKQLLLVRPVEHVLAMSVLHFEAEVRPTCMFTSEAPIVALDPKELKLTKMLMESMLEDKLDLSAHRDDYAEQLRELIQAKVEGREVVAAPQQDTTPQMVNLMEALERSVAESKKRKPTAGKKPPKQAAPGIAAKRAAQADQRSKRRKSS
jgi:DNA end-binding protein Ku